MSKTACLIYFFGKRYEQIGSIAIKSFKKHHPDVDIVHVNESNRGEYKSTYFLEQVGHGIYKYMLAYEIMKSKGYSKVIVLGADTITCSRLDEFLDDDNSDIIGTLDYPYPLVERGVVACPDPEEHLNGDVVCFNSQQALLDVIKESRRFKAYGEQGGLNYVSHSGLYGYTLNIADGPYCTSSHVYNVRSKGNICLPFEYQDHSSQGGPSPLYPPWEKPWGEFISQFYVNSDKLYDSNGKQIKVWHYCEGFGGMSDTVFVKIVNNYINKWFNKQTKQFFQQNCEAGDFFEKEFTL